VFILSRNNVNEQASLFLGTLFLQIHISTSGFVNLKNFVNSLRIGKVFVLLNYHRFIHNPYVTNIFFFLKLYQRLLLDNPCNHHYLNQQTSYWQLLILTANTRKSNSQKDNRTVQTIRCCQTLLQSFSGTHPNLFHTQPNRAQLNYTSQPLSHTMKYIRNWIIHLNLSFSYKEIHLKLNYTSQSLTYLTK